MIHFSPDPWSNGVLNKETHGPLVRKLDQFVSDAGIMAPYVWTSPIGLLGDAEIEWLKGFRELRQRGICGLCYVGVHFDPTVETRMSLIAGSNLRNYVRARVMSIDSIVTANRYDGPPQATTLLLPGFTEAKPEAKKASIIVDLLLSRYGDSKAQTVVYASSFDAITKAYGQMLCDHVRSYYTIIQGATK